MPTAGEVIGLVAIIAAVLLTFAVFIIIIIIIIFLVSYNRCRSCTVKNGVYNVWSCKTGMAELHLLLDFNFSHTE